MNYRRALTARKVAILGVVAVCITGTGAAAWIIGGPITGTTHLNGAQIMFDWRVPDTSADRWSGHGHDHEKLIDWSTTAPIVPEFVPDVWIGPHYAADVNVFCSATGAMPSWDVTISLKIEGVWPFYDATGLSVRECHSDTTWSDVALLVVDGDLVGNLVTKTFVTDEVMLMSLEFVWNNYSLADDLTFTVTATVD